MKARVQEGCTVNVVMSSQKSDGLSDLFHTLYVFLVLMKIVVCTFFFVFTLSLLRYLLSSMWCQFQQHGCNRKYVIKSRLSNPAIHTNVLFIIFYDYAFFYHINSSFKQKWYFSSFLLLWDIVSSPDLLVQAVASLLLHCLIQFVFTALCLLSPTSFVIWINMVFGFMWCQKEMVFLDQRNCLILHNF